MDVLELVDQLWRGEVSVREPSPGHPVRSAAPPSATAWPSCPSFANVARSRPTTASCSSTPAAQFAGARHPQPCARRGRRPGCDTAVYTHGHIDHVFGIAGVRGGGAGATAGRHGSIAPRGGAAAASTATALTAGYNAVINQRQFQVPGLRWPTEYRYPDVTYRDRLDLDVGGVALRAAPRAGRDRRPHVGVGARTPGALHRRPRSSGATPNAGNPQKVQRYAAGVGGRAAGRWRRSEPELLLPGHGLPIVGRRPRAQVLLDTADAARVACATQTLALMNEGARLDDIIHTVRAPARSARAAVPAPDLRRSRVHRAQHLAPLRRLVRRQPGRR